MSVVCIDKRGRVILPKGIREMGDRAVVISAGSFAVVIPIAKEPASVAEGWLKSKKGRNLGWLRRREQKPTLLRELNSDWLKPNSQTHSLSQYLLRWPDER